GHGDEGAGGESAAASAEIDAQGRAGAGFANDRNVAVAVVVVIAGGQSGHGAGAARYEAVRKSRKRRSAKNDPHIAVGKADGDIGKTVVIKVRRLEGKRRSRKIERKSVSAKPTAEKEHDAVIRGVGNGDVL